MFVVFDLDGTLASLDHRLHFIKRDTPDWASFYAACGDDTPIASVCAVYMAMLQAGHRVEVWSGRSDEVREVTEKWFRDNDLLVPDRLIMRSEGDYTPDDKLKKSWMRPGHIPDLVFDDRQRVVDMWRAEGIKCAQVEAWHE